MPRTLSLLLLASLVACCGCTMCAHPHDYCGPTFTGGQDDCGDCGTGCGTGCGDACDPMARAGSILSPPLRTVAVNVPMSVSAPAEDGMNRDSGAPRLEDLPSEPSLAPTPAPAPVRTTRLPRHNAPPLR